MFTAPQLGLAPSQEGLPRASSKQRTGIIINVSMPRIVPVLLIPQRLTVKVHRIACLSFFSAPPCGQKMTHPQPEGHELIRLENWRPSSLLHFMGQEISTPFPTPSPLLQPHQATSHLVLSLLPFTPFLPSFTSACFTCGPCSPCSPHPILTSPP